MRVVGGVAGVGGVGGMIPFRDISKNPTGQQFQG